VILRMLSRTQIAELLDVAAEHGMFVLLEAFDAADLEMAGALLESRASHGGAAHHAGRSRKQEELILIGINSRDLQTLKVVPERFAALAPRLPAGRPAVAESGVASAADARRMRQLGYGLALIGTALMASEDPSRLLGEIFHAARTVQT
jgi:indole-3-glycerol phosphate synthase